MKYCIIPIFISHRGCPFDCIFCNQRKISGQELAIGPDDIKKIIDESLKTIDSNTIVDVAFFGGSFTGIDINIQKEFLGIVNYYIKAGKIRGIRLSTRPDYISDSIVVMLKENMVNMVELGVQSMNDDVLYTANRGHKVSDILIAVDILKKHNMKFGIQTMIGLPGDNEKKAILTANKVIELVPDVVRIYPTVVLKDTYLENMYINKKYKPMALKKAVNLCSILLDLYNQNGINVIRVGLQANENLLHGKDLLKGPYHPAFRQLVESKNWLKKIIEMIRINNLEKYSSIKISVIPKIVSDVVGQKRNNIKILKKIFTYEKIVITEHKSMDNYLKVEGI